MAKAIALIASALCFFAVVAAHEHAHDDGHSFMVEGYVYCDVCRIGFDTSFANKLGELEQGRLGNAGVELRCRDRVSGKVTVSIKSKADGGGFYTIYANKDHEKDICEVRVMSSPLAYCNKTAPQMSHARVPLARNNGITTPRRYANPIGFMINEALPECYDVIHSKGFIPEF